ncbi:hypothetical protein SAMN04489716_3066 [Actinoplanes derwentensis]|uniref:Uncharacterized protein n=2 Tax=Actinoplanes derwentensis TaxID=113562 RepID=A0A1H1YZB7_9ACTN|nr:hypothetical protein SAMN04489716_3066 [Actinoplanes derwentensis]
MAVGYEGWAALERQTTVEITQCARADRHRVGGDQRQDGHLVKHALERR